jgi:hypothetical protein
MPCILSTSALDWIPQLQLQQFNPIKQPPVPIWQVDLKVGMDMVANRKIPDNARGQTTIIQPLQTILLTSNCTNNFLKYKKHYPSMNKSWVAIYLFNTCFKEWEVDTNETPGKLSIIIRQKELWEKAYPIVLRFMANVGSETVWTQCKKVNTDIISC